jgi:hypothetical protein
MQEKPLLLVDIDGVISLFGFDPDKRPDGTWCQVDGIAHLLSSRAATNLHRLAARFELAWCSGWEEKANEHLPHLLGVPSLPYLSFDAQLQKSGRHAHWKLAAIDAHAGPDRALAWVDDAFNDDCHAWAAERRGPTLLIQTDPAIGLDDGVVSELHAWALTSP